jgi:hypothetical protein
MSTLRALHAVIAEHGLFCSLYADRGVALLAHAKGRRKSGQAQSNPGHSPSSAPSSFRPTRRRRDRSERMFATRQKRLPQELWVAGITTMEAANRLLETVYLPRHNAAFARTPEARRSRHSQGRWRISSAFRKSVRSATITPCLTTTASCRSPPPLPLRQGDSAGSRVSGWHPCHLSWAAAPGAIYRRRRAS